MFRSPSCHLRRRSKTSLYCRMRRSTPLWASTCERSVQQHLPHAQKSICEMCRSTVRAVKA